MRRRLLTGLLGLALVVTALTPLTKSGAARATGQEDTFTIKTPAKPAGLPDYDIRLAGRGEFMDYDLSPAAGKQSGVQSTAQATAQQARGAALAAFRAGLAPEAASNLHAQVNEAGALKNLFSDGAPLAAPQAGAPDRIARDFLKQHAGLLALSAADLNGLALTNEDNDAGTLFQQLTIPAGTTPSLTFWLNITTNEAAGAAVFDRLFVEVRNTSGTLLATLATYSNQNAGIAGVYTQKGAFSLSSFAGQTVRVQFRATTDVTLPTSFRVDDVSVK